MTPNQFKQARQQLGLTQRQLSKELGLSDKNGDVYIRKVENGKANPSGLLIKAMEMFCEKKGLNRQISLRESATNLIKNRK